MRLSGTPTSDFLNGKSKVVNINLSDSQSIAEAISSVISATQDVEVVAGMAITKLCQAGEEYAKSIVPVDTGELRDSITHQVDVSDEVVTGIISAGSDHAMFVEFGTGIRGQESGYPLGDVEWTYDYKQQNWQGQPARPFMYDTAKFLSQNAKEIIGEM